MVSSYHKGYNWSVDTNKGMCDAMLKFGYLDNKEQVAEFTQNDTVTSSKIVMKKLWLDSKRKKNILDQAAISSEIAKAVNDFQPDLLFLGDDNAAQYIGVRFLDTSIPMVFWGVNHTPVKYDLVDSLERPGHNATGVYQTGYFAEGLELLKTIVPTVKTFAILSDESSTGRANTKAVEYLARKGLLPLKLTKTVATNDYELWKREAQELQKTTDAFFIAMYSTLKDESGNYVPNDQVAQWYLTHIKIPEATVGDHFVKQGLLCSANDSGYNQGFDAVEIAHDILANGATPSSYPPRTPKRGPLAVNKKRAAMLGISLKKEMGIEEYVE